MIGFYDYTVVLTFISLGISVFGMTRALNDQFRIAILCLALSGLCDMFDGKIARTKKNRTNDEKLYGIQLDSLCDVVCFGVFPVLICYLLGVRGFWGTLVLIYFSICGVTRLAFFNVLETNRQYGEDDKNHYYHGLPITSIAIALPLVFLTHFFVSENMLIIFLYITMLVVGTLYIIDFKFKKPDNLLLTVLVLIVGAAVLTIILFSNYHVDPLHERSFPFIKYIYDCFH